MRFLVSFALLSVVGLFVLPLQSPAVQTPIAFARAAHLKHGINLSMWYAQSNDYSAERLASFTTVDDFKLIRSSGFDHVRLSIDPDPLILEPQDGSLRPEAMARLDRTVQQITAEGLAVVLDIHATQPWNVTLAKGDENVSRFLAFWLSFSKHFAGTNPDLVYFEIFNEPNMEDQYRWVGIEARAVATIRAQAPKHTIIATGSQWSSIDTLVAMEPFRDDNIIYTFHDYNPMWFTHQGATWAQQDLAGLRGVPYPSSPEAVAPLLQQETQEEQRLWLERYGFERWDHARLDGEVAHAAEWAKRRNVPLWCGEFGVYRAYAPPAMRAQWVGDMRRALEAHGVGWAMWDYQGTFGLATKEKGVTTIDPDMLEALGLKR
jgi:endoglucanase